MALRNAQLMRQIQVLGQRNIYILAPALAKATVSRVTKWGWELKLLGRMSRTCCAKVLQQF